MTVKEISNSFESTMKTWMDSLDKYSPEQFAQNPSQESWSIGQVYSHLIFATKRAFVVIDKCLAGNENENEKKTEPGENAFRTNILSEVKVKLPATVPAPPQPQSAEEVKKEFKTITQDFLHIAEKVETSSAKGKEKHPVLGFMSAKEWLHTIEMHVRHHLKQKSELDTFFS